MLDEVGTWSKPTYDVPISKRHILHLLQCVVVVVAAIVHVEAILRPVAVAALVCVEAEERVVAAVRVVTVVSVVAVVCVVAIGRVQRAVAVDWWSTAPASQNSGFAFRPGLNF